MSEDPLKLRQLPSREPPGNLWEVIEARLDVRAQQNDSIGLVKSRRSPNRWMPLALAAAVSVLAVGLAVILNQTLPDNPMDPLPTAGIGTERLTTEPAIASTGLLIAQQASALLEQQLSRNSNQIVSANQMAALLMLENELGLVDELLTERPDDTRLWQQRVALLDQMNQGYSNGHWQTQMANASY